MLNVTISSPEQCFFDTSATSVTLPGVVGEFEIRKDHVPIISLLKMGSIVVQTAYDDFVLYIEAGIVEVSNNTVSILVDSAHLARVDEQAKIEASARQLRRELHQQDTVNYTTLLMELTKLSAEIQTIRRTKSKRGR